MMQDSSINDFEKELLSLTCTDLKLNIRNGHIKKDFNWVISQTKAFAHWTDIQPIFGKGYDIYKKQRDDFNNGLSVEYFKVVTIGERHRYNDSSFLNTYGNQLRDNLMITYDINLNDLNRINLLYKRIEKVYNEAVRLKECFDNSRNYFLENKDNNIVYLMAFESVPPSSPTLADWNNFEKVFLKKEVHTRGEAIYTVWGNDMVSELRTANNEVSYFTKDFFDDLTELFFYRKEVLELIIKELESAVSNSKDGKKHFEQVESIDAKFNTYDYFKTIPFEIEYAYKHSAPYYYDGQSWTEYNFNEIKTPFKMNAWEVLRAYWKEEYYNESLERITFENINPYFESYHNGFMKAYCGYEEKIKTSVSVFGNNNTMANRVFDDAMKLVHGTGHKIDFIDEKRVKVIKIDDWYKCGLLAGENYKAWYLVVNNYREFIPLFRTSEIMINFYKTSLRCTEDIEFYAGTRERLINLLNEISTPPAPKEIEQGKVKKEQKGGNRVIPLTKQDRINTYSKYVKDICQRYNGQQSINYPKISDVMKDAISKPNQKSERQLGRDASDLNLIEEGSDKTLLTYTGQVVRQYCIDNSLNFSWFK
jgi:hypothetical protein